MKVRKSKLSLVVGTICLALCIDRASSSKNGRKLSRSHFEFSLDLYKQLSGNFSSERNLVFSPYSANTLLSMLFLGTSSFSNSSKSLRQVLHYDNISYVDVHKSFKDIIKNFDENYYRDILKVVHGVFYQQGVIVSPHYIRALDEFYLVRAQDIDFKKSCQDLIERCNRWVSNKTGGQFANAIGSRFNCQANLLMISALGIQSQLSSPFNSENTFLKGLFYLPGNKRMEVSMMSGRFQLPFGYSRELECSILEMGFVQKRISLFLLLPDDPIDGINQLEKNLTSNSIKSLFAKLKDEVVNVRIPRFEISSSVDLKETLSAMGLDSLFVESNHDFSLMTQKDAMHITAIPHLASLKLTESSNNQSSSRTALERGGIFNHYFEADHPFIFIVWDYFTGMVLLMGKVVHP